MAKKAQNNQPIEKRNLNYLQQQQQRSHNLGQLWFVCLVYVKKLASVRRTCSGFYSIFHYRSNVFFVMSMKMQPLHSCDCEKPTKQTNNQTDKTNDFSDEKIETLSFDSLIAIKPEKGGGIEGENERFIAKLAVVWGSEATKMQKLNASKMAFNTSVTGHNCLAGALIWSAFDAWADRCVLSRFNIQHTA